MPGWTTRKTSPECTQPIRGLEKPDKVAQGTHNQTSYPRVQWENTLDKRGTKEPQAKRVTKQAREEEREPSEQQQRGM